MSDVALQSLYRLFSHPVFVSSFSSWLIAQFIKTVIEILKNRPRNYRSLILSMFWTTGGMPSSHSAVVTALATAVAVTSGVDSPLFITTLFFALLVFRDALGVRRSTGLQAKTLNMIGRELAIRDGLAFEPVKEIHGHTPAEVTVGAFLGFSIALAFCTL